MVLDIDSLCTRDTRKDDLPLAISHDTGAGGILIFVLGRCRPFVAGFLLFHFGLNFAVFGVNHDREIDRRQFTALSDDRGFWRLIADGGFWGGRQSRCVIFR